MLVESTLLKVFLFYVQKGYLLQQPSPENKIRILNAWFNFKAKLLQ
jgi:hypothetical protein